jgi:endoglucanase
MIPSNQAPIFKWRLASVGALVALVALVFVSAGLASSAVSGGQNPGAHAPNPLKGQVWWDQNTKWNETWNGYRSLLHRGRKGDAAKVKLLAESPQFRWFGMWEQPVGYKLRGMFEAAGDEVPLLAVFGDKHGCGGGGAALARYRRWIGRVARGIGSNEVVIAFEPDSLGLMRCRAHVATLRYAVHRLSKLPNATVYIEAGASDWMTPHQAASRLKAVGVRYVRGFMLNATHQTTTAANIRHGRKISHLLRGKHFIINTSHNGNGPLYRNGHTIWCNPPNEAAGTRPTTKTADPHVDAYMWVERPGFSNGACNGGPAKVGAWWEKRAIQMVNRAKWYRHRH